MNDNHGPSAVGERVRKQKVFGLAASVVVITMVGWLLTSGSQLLLRPTPGIAALPLGNLLVWIGLMAWVFFWWAVFLPLRRCSTSWLRKLALVRNGSMLMALVWMPVTVLLAGNLRLAFSRQSAFGDPDIASGITLIVTAVVLLLPIMGFLLVYISDWRQDSG